jgi:hypothetical protein
MPATGTEFSDRDVGIHVIPKPMLTATATPVAGYTVLVAAKPGVRYIIHGFQMTGRNVVTDTNTGCTMTYTQNGSIIGCGNIAFVPLSAEVRSIAITGLSLMCDVNTAIRAATVSDVYTFMVAYVWYSEVGAS